STPGNSHSLERLPMNSVHRWSPIVARALVITPALIATTYTGTASSPDDQESSRNEGQGHDRFYSVHNLVSDGFVKANDLDTDLVNPWGVAFNPNGFVWVADNHSGLSTLYDGFGVKNSLIGSIPPAPGGTPPGAPTGIVFSSGTDFCLTRGHP